MTFFGFTRERENAKRAARARSVYFSPLRTLQPLREPKYFTQRPQIRYFVPPRLRVNQYSPMVQL